MEADEEFLLRKRLCQLEGNPLDPLGACPRIHFLILLNSLEK
jgi:hypothetical protein